MGDFDLALAMMSLAREKASGLLEVEAGEKHAEIEWSAGHPVYADESTLGEPLGRLLVRQGVLTPAQYETAIERLAEHVGADQPLRFGDMLVRLGFLDHDQVQQALLDQLRWRVVRCLQLEEPTWRFSASYKSEDPTATFSFDVEPIVLLATRWTDPARLDRFLSTRLGRTPRIVGSPRRVAALLGLDAHEKPLVARLAAADTLQAALGDVEAKVDARAIVTALILTGSCTLSAAAEAAPVPETLTFTSELARPLTPLTSLPSIPPSANVLSRMARTKEPKKRKEKAPVPAPLPETVPEGSPEPPPIVAEAGDLPPRMDRRLEAERAFQAGKKLLEAQDLDHAAVELRRASQLLEGSAEYQVYIEWLEWLQGNTTPDHEASLSKTARQAVLHDANLAFPRYVLGRVAMKNGDLRRAKPLFQFAAKLDPNHAEAQQYLRLVESRDREGTDGTADAASEPVAASNEVAAPALEASAAAPPDGAIAAEPPRRQRKTAMAFSGLALVGVAFYAVRLLMPPAAGDVPVASSPASEAPPQAAAARSPAPSTQPSSSTPPPVTATLPVATTTASAPAAPVASASAAPSLGGADGAEVGDLVIPASAGKHRVWVDGVLVGESPLRLKRACGPHTVRIGSQGQTQTVDVACH